MKVFPTVGRATARRRTSCTRSSGPASSPATGSRSRSRPTTAPAAACASTSARPRARPRSSHKAINMEPVAEHRDVERERWDFFQSHPAARPRAARRTTRSRARQVLEPLFEFSGACAGCGETPYLRLVSQLFGDRMIVANATGCSSIYGANLPTTPWTVNAAGRGPAWSNSLFEDNAEFGLGMRLALDAQTDQARRLLDAARAEVGEELVAEILDAARTPSRRSPRSASASTACATRSGAIDGPARPTHATCSRSPATSSRRAVWIIGGDGWAYDIGFGGLDHVLASGRNVNILVLDTEVYSNTGGQASKATPRGAVAKFAAAGKGTRQEGPRRDRARLRQRLRGAGLDGRQRLADDQGAARGRRLAGSVAGHRLQHLHRPRDRHGDVDEPPEGRRQERLLAAVPLPPVARSRAATVQARLGAADRSRSRDFVGDRDPLRRSSSAPTPDGRRARRAARRPTPTSAGATTSSSPASSAPSRTSDRRRPGDRRPRSRATRATATTEETER